MAARFWTVPLLVYVFRFKVIGKLRNMAGAEVKRLPRTNRNLLVDFFFVCSAYKIIKTYVVIFGKPN